MIQNLRTLLILPFLALAVTACASSGQIAEQDQTQKLAIERWHRCVDSSLDRLRAEVTRLDGMVEETLFVCQGHKSDVLATFPTRMEKALDNMMVQQVYETGLTQMAGSKIGGADIAPLTNSLLSLY